MLPNIHNTMAERSRILIIKEPEFFADKESLIYIDTSNELSAFVKNTL